MQNENVVRDLEVSDGDRSLKVAYFIESGMIHANIDGRTIRVRVGADGSEETVKRLVLGQLHIKSWRERLLDRWGHR